MTARDQRRAPGTLESEVMSVLWTHGEPLSAAGVQQALSGDLAHNTVQTILVRLHDKALLQRRRAGRGHEYWPARDAASAAAEQMRAALGDRQDRLAVLQHFAASLDEADADALRELLATYRECAPSARRRPVW